MKKVLALLFTLCLILTGCNTKKSEDSNPDPVPTPDPIPTYTNEEIRHKLKSTCFEYQTRIKEKQQFKLSGDINIPDLNFEGMHVYKDLEAIVDNKTADPYIKFKTDVYLKEDNKLSEEPIKRIEVHKHNEGTPVEILPGLPPLPSDTVEYTLSDYKDGKKSYDKIVDKNGAAKFNVIMQGIIALVKEFKVEDLPKTIKYTYNRDKVTYGMEFGFEDLKGTQLSEAMNALLGFFPELNELILQFKDEIIIKIDNIYLDVPVTNFNLSVSYPAMQGQFLFPIIEGHFDISYKPVFRTDITKFKIDDTYLKAKVGANNVKNYLKPVTENEKEVYKAGLIVDSFMSIDLSNEDILGQILSKKYQISAPGSKSIKYYNSRTKEEIDVNNNILTVDMLQNILVEVTYEDNGDHIVTIANYLAEPQPSLPDGQEI